MVPIIATMNLQTTMPAAPQIRSGRRPNLSIVQNEIGVEHTLTNVVIREIRNRFLIVPSELKKLVPK